MARGTQFLSLVTDLRAELRRSSSIAVGVDDLSSLKQTLNRVYQTLVMQYDWPHLKRIFAAMSLAAGQRYYDFPTDLVPERVIRAVIWYSNIPNDLPRGIDFEQYASYDSDSDDRAEPALRWDVRWTGTKEQIEIWPIPNTNDQKVQFAGVHDTPKLVTDANVCLLDDHLVILFAAAELLGAQESPDAPLKLQAAQGHLKMLQARAKGGITGYQLGLGRTPTTTANRATIRISSS